MNESLTDMVGRVAEIIGAGNSMAAADLASFAVDGVTPGAVALPDSVEQVSRLLAFANDNGLSVVPWGGGTAMSQGQPASACRSGCFARAHEQGARLLA